MEVYEYIHNRWYIADPSRADKCIYLHPDGVWRRDMSMPGGKLGFFGSEQAARDLMAQHKLEEAIGSIWDGIW